MTGEWSMNRIVDSLMPKKSADPNAVTLHPEFLETGIDKLHPGLKQWTAFTPGPCRLVSIEVCVHLDDGDIAPTGGVQGSGETDFGTVYPLVF